MSITTHNAYVNELLLWRTVNDRIAWFIFRQVINQIILRLCRTTSNYIPYENRSIEKIHILILISQEQYLTARFKCHWSQYKNYINYFLIFWILLQKHFGSELLTMRIPMGPNIMSITIHIYWVHWQLGLVTISPMY